MGVLVQSVFEIRRQDSPEPVRHVVIDAYPCRIGRGYDCDVIVSDPYVDAHHVEITLNPDQDGWLVRDLESVNGFSAITDSGDISGKDCHILSSGNKVVLGHTEIRLLKPDHPVTAAKKMIQASAMWQFVSRPLNDWMLFILAGLVMAGWSFLEIWTENAMQTLLINVCVSAVFILVWSAGWSIAGRFIKHKSNFNAHIAVISLYFILSTVLWMMQSYIVFLLNQNIVSDAINVVWNVVLGAALLYGALSLAAEMTPRKRMISSGFFAVGVTAGIMSVSTLAAPSFSPVPDYPPTLQPIAEVLIPSQTPDVFFEQAQTLFTKGALQE